MKDGVLTKKEIEAMRKADLVAMVKELYVCDCQKITGPSDVASVLNSKIGRSKQEHFVAIYVDGANNIIETRVAFKGTLNSCVVHPREIFAPAFEMRAAAVIIGHNHPSGNIEPSFEDIAMTKKLTEAGNILGIEVLDHVIVAKANYYSFKTNGKI
jgi:DNA repair protein RadC